MQQINTFHYWKLSFRSQKYAETRNTSKFWISCFNVFYVAGVYFFFLSSTCFGAAFKSLVSLSCSVSLTCLNYSLIKSKMCLESVLLDTCAQGASLLMEHLGDIVQGTATAVWGLWERNSVDALSGCSPSIWVPVRCPEWLTSTCQSCKLWRAKCSRCCKNSFPSRH